MGRRKEVLGEAVQVGSVARTKQCLRGLGLGQAFMQGVAAVRVGLARATAAGGAVVGRDGAAFGVGGVDGLVEELAAGGVAISWGTFHPLSKAKSSAHPRVQCGAGRYGNAGDAGRRSGQAEGLDNVWKEEEEAADDDEEEGGRGGGARREAGHIYRVEDEACITQGQGMVRVGHEAVKRVWLWTLLQMD